MASRTATPDTPRRRSPTARTASPRPTKPLSGKTSPKSITPSQRTRESSLLANRKRASPTPSDKTDSERSPSSVMLMSPGEVAEQQGSIEQVIKSIEKQLKAEQDKISRIILEKQQHQIKYKLENHMDAHLTPFVMIKKVGKSGNEGSIKSGNEGGIKSVSEGNVKKDPPIKSKTQPSTTKPSATQKRSQTLSSTSSNNLKRTGSTSSKSPSTNTTTQPPQAPTKRICTCGDPNSIWCFVCESRRFKNDFPKWTSGNKMIDNFIKEIQLFGESEVNYLEWIPYDRFKEVKFICDGTYASLSLATWLDGPRNLTDKNNIKKLKRDARKKVMLKQLHNSENISEVYLSELNKYYKKISWNNSIMPVYGMSKDPKTKNFIIIYEHAEHGDLNNYLQENSVNMGWPLKLALACDISKSLKTLHSCSLIHKDIHSGNILILKDGSTALTDFGICKHVDAENRNLKIGQVEGVLPFIAPEVIRTQKYSKQSDIYSFAMVMWEISAGGKRPFDDRSHDAGLALEILEGKRPDPVSGTPPCWVELVEQCWNENPDKRPDADAVHRTLYDWLKKLVETPKLPYKVNTEFMLAENWRIRGQYQSNTPQYGTRRVSLISGNNGEEDNVSQETSVQESSGEESTTTTVVDPEGGIEIDASMVEKIESELEAGRFQHPVTCYTSQLFDLSELRIFASTETTVITEEPNTLESSMSANDGEQSVIDNTKPDTKSDTTETPVNEEHSTVNADTEGSSIINSSVSDTEKPIIIEVPVSETEEPITVDVPVSEDRESSTNDEPIPANEKPSIVIVDVTGESDIVDTPVPETEEPSTIEASTSVNASVSDIKEPSNVDVHIPSSINEEIITIDVPSWPNEKPNTVDGIIDVPSWTNEKPNTVDGIIDVPSWTNEKPNTVDGIIDVPSWTNEKPNTVDGIIDVPSWTNEKPNTVDGVIDVPSWTNEKPNTVDGIIDVPSWTNQKPNTVDGVIDVPSWTNEKPNTVDGIMDVPVFVKPPSSVEKLTINTTTAINKIVESVRSETPDDETEADVKSDSPLCSEMSPPTSPSGSEASSNDGKEGNKNLNLKIGDQYRHAIELEF